MPSPSAFNVNKSNKWLLWHHRLGHPSDKILLSPVSSFENSDVLNSTSDVVQHCKHCLSGKMHQLPFNKSISKATKLLELSHSDVSDPTPLVSINDFVNL